MLNRQHRPPESLFRLYLYIKALRLPSVRFRGSYRRSRSFGFTFFRRNDYPNHGISYHFYRWRHEFTEILRIFAPCKQIARLGGASAIGASSIAFSLHEPCARYDKRKNHPDRQRGCVQQTVRMGDATPAGDSGALGPAASLVEEPRRAVLF